MLPRRPAAPGWLELSLLGLLLLAALALRTHRLGVPTLTGDEWFMLRNHVEGAAWIVSQARSFEPHPLLYYLGFWAWVGAAGSTEWAMRYPSVLFGVLAGAAVWRLARDVAGPLAAVGALALFAVNPYQVAQAQNARNYAMVAALATLATAALLVATRSGGRTWTRYALLMLLALHTHLNALLVAAAHVLWIALRALLQRRPPPREAFRAGVLIALLFLPWLLYAAPALGAYRGYYPERVTPYEVALRTLATFAFGQHEAPRRALLALVGVAALVGGAWCVSRALRHARADALLVALAAAVPIAGAALLFLVRPMFEERYLIVAAPAVVAVVAIGALQLGRLHKAAPLVGFALLVAVTAPFLQRHYPAVEASRPDWRGLAAWIASAERPGDLVLITGHGVADAWSYYRRGSSPVAVVAEPATTASELPRALAERRGVFHLPYWEGEADRRVHDGLVATAFPAESRWFRGQRAQFFALQAPDSPLLPLGATWLDRIELIGASVGPSQLRPGDPIQVLLRWRTNGDAPDLKLSLRLLDPAGQSVAQLDRRPVDETRPFPTMKPGELVRDGHALRAPPSVAPGRYQVALLLYRPEDARAVPPAPGRAPTIEAVPDLVVLGDVEIAAQ